MFNSPCTSVVLLLSASKTLEILPPNEMGEKVATQRRNRPPSQKKWLTSNSRKNRKDEYSWSNVFESNTTLFVILGATVAGVLLARYLISYPGTSLNSKAMSENNDVKDKAETLNAHANDKVSAVKINKEAQEFKPTIHKILSPISMTYNNRQIKFKELKHGNKKSNVHVYIADNFLSQRECDGLTAAHFSHVTETSKRSPIVCFAGVQTMNKHLNEVGIEYTASVSDFTPGTLCLNESFSRSLAQKFSYSYSTAFYRGDSKFSYTFEEQIEKMTGLSKLHGGKFQITSYQTGVGYKNHTDCTENDDIRDRFATVLVYLQDVKEGGETKFPKLGISVKPKKGRLLVWNNMKPDGMCDPTSLHNAAHVLSGHKVIIQRWYYYKNFYSLGKASPEPLLPRRELHQPMVSCDQYEQGSCRWYDEWGYNHLVDYNSMQHKLA